MSGMFLFYIIGSLIIGAFGMYAQAKVQSNFHRYSSVTPSSGLTGAEAAMEMLRRSGIPYIRVERVGGFLSDHYDPSTKVIRLSPDVYDGRNLSALGVACHEAGHALQHAQNYAPLMIRSMAVPMASFGSSAGILILMAGLMLQYQGLGLGHVLAVIGLLLFGTVMVFQVINLPVEFDASERAKEALVNFSLIQRGPEEQAVAKVLGAAAMTYVAATVSAIFTFLYYAMLVFGQRRE